MPLIGDDRHGIILAVIAVIIIVLLILAVLAVIFIPFRETKVSETRSAALSEGLSSISFTLSIDRGIVLVRFVNDSATAIKMSVTGHERGGLFSSKSVNLSWTEESVGDSLNVASIIKGGGGIGLLDASSINCTVNIAKQLKTSLTITDDRGGVDVRTEDGVELTRASIKAVTGGARLELVSNSTLSGPLTMEASLGGVDLSWNNVRTTSDTTVLLNTTTGGVRASFDQTEASTGIVNVGINTDLGGIDATINIAGDVSGRVFSSAKTGGINVRQQSGFNGTSGLLVSENFPTSSQIDMTCTANRGGVNLWAKYGP